MHRLVVGRTLAEIFDLPEEKEGLVFTTIRSERQIDQFRHEVAVRETAADLAWSEHASRLLKLVAVEVLPVQKFNSMPASETGWLVMLIRVEQIEGREEFTEVEFLIGEWKPEKARQLREFAAKHGKPLTGFMVYTPMRFREATDEEQAREPSGKIKEALRGLNVDAARLGRKMIEVQEPDKPWFRAAIE